MDYTNYNSSITLKYKSGRIFCASFGPHEIISVQVDAYAYVIQAKSVHAAKIMITKHAKKILK